MENDGLLKTSPINGYMWPPYGYMCDYVTNNSQFNQVHLYSLCTSDHSENTYNIHPCVTWSWITNVCWRYWRSTWAIPLQVIQGWILYIFSLWSDVHSLYNILFTLWSPLVPPLDALVIPQPWPQAEHSLWPATARAYLWRSYPRTTLWWGHSRGQGIRDDAWPSRASGEGTPSAGCALGSGTQGSP